MKKEFSDAKVVPTNESGRSLCTHTIKLRLSAEELGSWREAAAQECVSLSAWVRSMCNESPCAHKVEEPVQKNAVEKHGLKKADKNGRCRHGIAVAGYCMGCGS